LYSRYFLLWSKGFIILAEMFDTTVFTEGFAGIADGTAVENDAVAEGRRGLGRENFAKLPLDFFRLLQVIHQAEAVGDADAVGIHNGAAGDMEHVTEDQVGGLAADAGKGGELLHGGRDLTVMLFQQDFGTRHNIPGFGMIEAAGMDILLHLGDIGYGEIFQSGIAGKEGRGDLIDTLIRTLGGKTDGKEELVGFGIVEGTVGLRVFR
jgi:hypothetical protein